MMGFLLGTYLVGFLISIVLFYIAFMRTKANASWFGILAITAGARRRAVGHLLRVLVDFPTGILQDYVTLPWPFG